MATLDDVAHLPCFQDALLEGRHPLLSVRDVAALRVSGAVSPAVLESYWKRVAGDIEAAMEESTSPCRLNFMPKPLAILTNKDSLLGLSAGQIAKVAKGMGLPNWKTGVENAAAILEAHNEGLVIARHPLSPVHIAAYKHLSSWRVTKSTVLKKWKLRPRVLAGLPFQKREYFPRMVLYQLRDVVACLNTWCPDPARQPMSWDAGVELIQCPQPAGRKRWASEADLRAAADVARTKRLRKNEERNRARRLENELYEDKNQWRIPDLSDRLRLLASWERSALIREVLRTVSLRVYLGYSIRLGLKLEDAWRAAEADQAELTRLATQIWRRYRTEVRS